MILMTDFLDPLKMLVFYGEPRKAMLSDCGQYGIYG